MQAINQSTQVHGYMQIESANVDYKSNRKCSSGRRVCVYECASELFNAYTACVK